MEENTTTKVLAIGPNLTQAWELYKKHWQLLVPASIIVFIPDLLSMLMGDDKTAAAGLFSLLLSVCSLFLASGSIYFGLKLIRSGEAEITDFQVLLCHRNHRRYRSSLGWSRLARYCTDCHAYGNCRI